MRRLSMICLITLCLLTGCVAQHTINEQSRTTPPLPVYGDVLHSLNLQNWNEFTEHTIEWKDTTISALALTDIISMAEPYSEQFSLHITGCDGVATEITDLEGAFLTWSPTFGWQLISHRHPVSAGIKNIASIVVVNHSFDWENGFYILSTTENLLHLTPGQLYCSSTQNIVYKDGTSKQGEVEAIAYRHKTVIPFAQHLNLSPNIPMVVFSEEDTQLRVLSNGYLELKENTLNYTNTSGKTLPHTVKGVMLYPPEKSIMDIHLDVKKMLDMDERVMVLLLDGVGASVYDQACQMGLCPNLSALPQQETALSVFPPITPAGTAAMITGQPPACNGITNRNKHELAVPDIFNLASEKNLTSILVEGDAKIINTSIEPRLNLDLDGDGTTDQEVFTAAKQAISEEPALIMVHFHGTDDLSHTYGPRSEEAFARLQLIDSYVGELIQLWDGRVLITADHGQHQTQNADRLGSHGQIRYEDLMVPYLTR